MTFSRTQLGNSGVRVLLAGVAKPISAFVDPEGGKQVCVSGRLLSR